MPNQNDPTRIPSPAPGRRTPALACAGVAAALLLGLPGCGQPTPAERGSDAGRSEADALAHPDSYARSDATAFVDAPDVPDASEASEASEASDAQPVQTLPLPGTLSPATTLSVPQTISKLGLLSDPLVIAGYLDVTRYGADPSGNADSTDAFQNAMNDATGNASGGGGTSMVVYVPSGSYLVHDTLTGVQTYGVNNVRYGSISHYGGQLAPSLVGSPLNPPTIVLQDGSANFGSASSPRPIVRLVNTPDAGGGGCGGQWQDGTSGCWDILFNAVVRDINVKTGNNPGAIGVQMYAAQKSYIQNVSVDATGGYAGVQGTPGTEVWTNVTVQGGQYGLLVNTGGGAAAIAGLTLSGQSSAGIYYNHIVGDLALTGFSIEETDPSATGIRSTDGIAQGTTVSLIDGVISVASSTEPAIDNVGGDSLYLDDVFLQSTSPSLIANKGSTSVAATGSLQLVVQYAHVDQATDPTVNPNGRYAVGGEIVTLDNTGTQLSLQRTDVGPTFGASAMPPSDLVARHVPLPMPWAFDTNVVWVTDHGADPTGFTDSTAQIQSAIEIAHTAGSDEVFLPRGDYSLSGTLRLYANTKFFGIPGSYAHLFAFGWVTGNKLQPFVQVGDAVNDAAAAQAGTAVMSDIAFFMPVNSVQFPEYAKLLPNDGAGYQTLDQTYLYAIDWQAGAQSICNQVNISFQYNTLKVPSAPSRNYIQVDHTGGGRWYGLQVAGDWGPNGPNGTTLYVTGTTAPLTLYGSNPEHSSGLSFYGFDHAANIRVLGLKMEGGGNTYLVDIGSSSNIMLSGFTGHGEFTFAAHGSSTNLNFNTAMYYTSGSDPDPPFYLNTDTNQSYSFADAYALFQIGGFDDSVFPTCSKGLVCP